METWFWILGWFLSILTITGNGLIIFLVCCKRQLRTKTNVFVISLAVADFCVGLTAVPLLFSSRKTHSEDQLPTDGEHFVTWLFMEASVTNMCSLVLDRYMAVVKPLKYLTFMKHRRVIQMVSLSWAFPVVFIIVKSSLLLSFKSAVSVLMWLSMTFFEFVPCFMLIFCFAAMLRVVCKHDRAARTLAKQLRFNNHALCIKPQEKTAVNIMAIVIGVFLVCCGIQLRCGLMIVFNSNIDQLCNVLHLQVLVVVLNSAVNPLAYALFKRDIKKELHRLICFSRLQKRNYLS
ncbi:octopamine receptor beta-2R-like [Oculina patagonica]